MCHGWRIEDMFDAEIGQCQVAEPFSGMVGKHQWLFLNTLDTAASVGKLVAFYVDQHNSHLPHSAFKGQTPDEMYYGTGDDIPKTLEEAKLQAREVRLKSNRERNCHVCALPTSASC